MLHKRAAQLGIDIDDMTTCRHAATTSNAAWMIPMKRTQIQLDERTYEVLRRRAFEMDCSISSYYEREVLS